MRPLFFEFFHHCRGQFHGYRVAWELIGGGEEITFEREGVRIDVANHHGIAGGFYEIIGREEVAGFEFVGDVVKSFAFANGERSLVDLALGELPEYFAAAGGAIE